MSSALTLPDKGTFDTDEQFLALDVRGQIVRNRMEVLTELIASLRADFAAGRFRAVVIHFRIF
jgi:hypothetical protein